VLKDVKRRRLRLDPEPGARGGRPHPVEIALLDWGGSGPLALLHHANGFCAATWGLVAEGLRDRFRLVAMDARGHGDSSRPSGPDAFSWSALAEDLIAVGERLLEESGGGRIALGLGHSFGGTLTLAAAARRPRLYERIALVDPVIVPRELGGEHHSRGSELAERARKRRHVWQDREEARAFFAERELFQDWDPRALDLYVEEGLRQRADGRVELKCAGEVEAAIFAGNQSLDPGAEASAVRVPALFLRAGRGNFPRRLYQQLVDRMQGAVIEEVDAGHLAPMERPDLVIEAVLRFCGEK
jgi:pimeloyl-ACP methyl ester carboxylesterase